MLIFITGILLTSSFKIMIREKLQNLLFSQQQNKNNQIDWSFLLTVRLWGIRLRRFIWIWRLKFLRWLQGLEGYIPLSFGSFLNYNFKIWIYYLFRHVPPKYPPTWGGGEVHDGTSRHVPPQVPPPVKNNSYNCSNRK